MRTDIEKNKRIIIKLIIGMILLLSDIALWHLLEIDIGYIGLAIVLFTLTIFFILSEGTMFENLYIKKE